MWKALEILDAFNTLTLEKIFWKTKTLFKNQEYHFLVEITKIENATYRYDTALSEAKVKKNRMGSTKWTYQNERSFDINYFIFSKILFQFKNVV